MLINVIVTRKLFLPFVSMFIYCMFILGLEPFVIIK